ncbi:MAG: tetratricopeptide repeat protein, partial [Chloroflexota bacterium]
ACALIQVGYLAYYPGDYVIARARAEEGLVRSREINDKKVMSLALHTLGSVALQQGEFATARALWEECLALRREVGDKYTIADSLTVLGNLALNQMNYAEARARYEEGLVLAREGGRKVQIAILMGNLGAVALNQRDHVSARQMFAEALTVLRESGGNKRNIIAALVEFAGLGTAQEQWERATRLSGAVEALTEAIGTRMDREERVEHEHTASAARTQLDRATFNRLWKEGRAMTMERAIEYALEETG